MVAIAGPRFNLIVEGSIHQTSRAAKRCLIKAGLDSSCLGLLINTGVYRDKHIVEPAIASFIQRKISTIFVNRSHSVPPGDLEGTFSFDVNNGGCGLITGMQLIDGFIHSGRIQQGMVVTGDAEPFRGLSKSFDFAPAAAAIILSAAVDGEGFTRFKTYTFPKYKDAFESHIYGTSWKNKRKNRNVLFISEKENYLDLCVECATQSLKNFLSEADLTLPEIDLVISSQSPKGFVSKLKIQCDLADRIVDVDTSKGEIHTAGPAFALEKAWNDGRFEQARNILFLSVGSGITTALALYRNDLKQ